MGKKHVCDSLKVFEKKEMFNLSNTIVIEWHGMTVK